MRESKIYMVIGSGGVEKLSVTKDSLEEGLGMAFSIMDCILDLDTAATERFRKSKVEVSAHA